MNLPEGMGTRRICRFLLAPLAVAWFLSCSPPDKATPPNDAGNNLEEVLNTVSTRWAAVDTMTADMTMDSAIAIGPLTVQMAASGPFEFLRGEDGERFRMDLTSTLRALVMGKTQGKLVTVCDGETVFQEMTLMGRVQVVKVKTGDLRGWMAEGEEPLSQLLHKQGEVVLLPDETIDEIPAYVVEVVLNKETRKEMSGSPVRTRLWFAKDSGARIRVESFDKSGKSLSAVSYSGLVIGAELAPSRFEYTPPEGASIIDVSEEEIGAVTLPF